MIADLGFVVQDEKTRCLSERHGSDPFRIGKIYRSKFLQAKRQNLLPILSQKKIQRIFSDKVIQQFSYRKLCAQIFVDQKFLVSHPTVKKGGVGIIIVAILIFSGLVVGFKDPTQVYCQDLGYEYVITEGPEGEFGICKLPDGSSCMDWDFLEGKCGKEYSYCKREGYEIKTISDPEKCIFSEECAVCVLENGEEIEVSKLMELKISGVVCGDGFCAPLTESHKDCPQDCPSGSFDLYCDKVGDGICDPDCVDEGIPEEDPDCVVVSTTIETTTTTMGTPAKKCGNNLCEYLRGENQLTCPEDCPSGKKDDYCDRVKDGVCDPDCGGGDDADCGLGYLLGYLPYIIISLVLTIIIYRIVKRQ